MLIVPNTIATSNGAGVVVLYSSRFLLMFVCQQEQLPCLLFSRTRAPRTAHPHHHMYNIILDANTILFVPHLDTVFSVTSAHLKTTFFPHSTIVCCTAGSTEPPQLLIAYLSGEDLNCVACARTKCRTCQYSTLGSNRLACRTQRVRTALISPWIWRLQSFPPVHMLVGVAFSPEERSTTLACGDNPQSSIPPEEVMTVADFVGLTAQAVFDRQLSGDRASIEKLSCRTEGDVREYECNLRNAIRYELEQYFIERFAPGAEATLELQSHLEVSTLSWSLPHPYTVSGFPKQHAFGHGLDDIGPQKIGTARHIRLSRVEGLPSS